MRAAEAAIDAVIGEKEVVNRGDERFAVGQREALHWNPVFDDLGVVGAVEMIVLAVPEVGERDGGDFVFAALKGQEEFGLYAA